MRDGTPRAEFNGSEVWKLGKRWICRVGFIVAFWAAPKMSAGHLLFALTTTVYILVAIVLEERDLTGFYGEPYRKYRNRVWALLPLSRINP